MLSPKSMTTADEKELAVLNAATEIFFVHGFSAATTDMIQRKAGVSKATMYACFPSKEAIFTAVIDKECRIMGHAFNTMKIVDGNIEDALTQLGVSYLQLVFSPSSIALFRLIVAEVPRFPEISHRFYLAGPKPVIDKITNYFINAANAGKININAIGATQAAQLFTSMLRGEGHLEYLTHPTSTLSMARQDLWVKNAVDTFLKAYGK